MSDSQPMDVDTPQPCPQHTSHTPPQPPAVDQAPGPAAQLPPRVGLVQVSPRDLSQFESSFELVKVMRDAIIAHQRLYEDAGVLHGDINPNTIVILDTPEGKSEGALIDYDLPHSPQSIRSLRDPDPVVPPPQKPRIRPYYWPGV